ncbi:MAG: sigma-54-dependent transcriptional regulator [Myxococcota bacterium]
MDFSSDEARHVLVVDDDEALGKVLEALLRQGGLCVASVTSGKAALEALERRPFDLVITDLRMPGMDGMALLESLGARWPALPVVMLTAHGTVPLAVEAMKAGAREFILKPFDRAELLYVVGAQLKQLGQHVEPPLAELTSSALLGESEPMQAVFRLIKKAARSSAHVLIRGESGTGKERVAEAIHAQSPRHAEAMVTVHCGALPDSLIESELFGYEKGAFTGATQRKPGRVELASHGTLFLDEIGDTSAMVQVKLLRVLQDRSFVRLGGTETLSVDTRFVAATHRDLEALVEAGDFREDLFYRLNVIPIDLPPLRHRGKDVLLLARHFMTTLGRDNGVPDAHLSDEALVRLGQHDWPGNVRQLQNVLERLIVLSDTPRIEVREVDKELSARRPSAASTLYTATEESLEVQRRKAEKGALEQTLLRCGNNRTQAARILGISRRTLYNKLEAHGLG